MCVGSPTAGAWSSFQRRPDDEFETDSMKATVPYAPTCLSISILKFRFYLAMVRQTDSESLFIEPLIVEHAVLPPSTVATPPLSRSNQTA